MEALNAWYEAATVEALRRAEEAILAVSSGPLTCAVPFELRGIDLERGAAVEPDPLRVEATWLARARVSEGGARCEALFGALGSDQRHHRIAHIVVGLDVPHPTLGVPMRVIPVTPPGRRPPVHADGVYGGPAIDGHYARLVRWNDAMRDRSWADLAVWVHTMLLEPVQALLAAGPDGEVTRWKFRDDAEPHPARPLEPDADALRFEPSGLLLGGDEVILDHGLLTIIDLRGDGVRRIDARGAYLVRATDTTLLLTSRDRFFALDRRSGAWIAPAPDEPLVDQEPGYDINHMTRDDGAHVRIDELAGYARTWAFAPDRRLLWVEDTERHGGILRARDAALVATLPGGFDEALPRGLPYFDEYSTEPELLDEALEMDDDPEQHRLGELRLRSPDAFALGPRGAMTFRAGIVAREGTPLFALTFPVHLAAFDAEGSRLATYSAARIGKDRDLIVDAPALRVFDVSQALPRLVTVRRLPASRLWRPPAA